MRLALSNSLALLTVITALTMAGCSDERVDPSAKTPEINTNNYFVNEQTIWLFNPKTGVATEVDTFEEGENKFINLDTDLKKQGFEYMVYVQRNGIMDDIYLKAYEKGSDARKRLTGTANHICGIYPRKAAADEGITGLDPNEMPTQDQYLIDVVSNENADCDKLTSQYHVIDISYLKPRSAGDPFKTLSIKETSSAFVLGTMLQNFGSTIDPDTGKAIRWGHIGYDVLNDSIQLYDQSYKLLWASKIEPGEEGEEGEKTVPHFFQATKELAIVQNDKKIYVRKISELFGLGRVESLDEDNLPANSAIASLFAKDTEDFTTDNANANNPISVRKDNNNFILKDGRRLLYYTAQNNAGFSQIYAASSNETDFEFSVLGGTPSHIIINATVTDQEGFPSQVLKARNSRTSAENTLASAEKIQYRVIGDSIYFNTFKGAGSSSWQAHRIAPPIHLEQSKSTYALSMFAFASDYQKNSTYPLILRSDNDSLSGALITPEIGPYNSNSETGLYSSQTFGGINYDVLTTNLDQPPTNLDQLSNFVLNDIYGGVFIESDDENAIHMFFFNRNEAKDSLKQMY